MVGEAGKMEQWVRPGGIGVERCGGRAGYLSQ